MDGPGCRVLGHGPRRRARLPRLDAQIHLTTHLHDRPLRSDGSLRNARARTTHAVQRGGQVIAELDEDGVRRCANRGRRRDQSQRRDAARCGKVRLSTPAKDTWMPEYRRQDKRRGRRPIDGAGRPTATVVVPQLP